MSPHIACFLWSFKLKVEAGSLINAFFLRKDTHVSTALHSSWWLLRLDSALPWDPVIKGYISEERKFIVSTLI